MQSSLEKLRKFFRLEAESEYANRAVIGGLSKILEAWEPEARTEGVPEEIIQLVASRLRDYQRLTPNSRAETLKGIWKRIQGQVPAAEPLPEPIYVESAPQTAGATDQTPPKPIPVEEHGTPPEPRPHVERRPAPPRSASYPASQTGQPVALNAALTVLQGVGPKHAQTLAALGLHTLGDMLYNFPRRYDDYSQLKPIHKLWYGDEVTVIGTIQSVSTRPLKGGQASLVEAVLSDGTGAIRLTWFNQPWIANRLSENLAVSISGKVEQYLGRLVFNNPDWELVETEHLHTNRIVPIYSLTASITQKWLRGLMNQVVSFWSPRVGDPLPESIRSSAELMPLGEAIKQAHFPDTQDKFKAARERLGFDEIFFLQMGVLRQKRDWQGVPARVFDAPQDWLDERIGKLPFELTNAQKRAVAEIRDDLKAGRPMNRLLQGDVGSGKTIVAAMAIAIITRAGAQAAVMAPTGILAEQHYRNLSQTLTEDGALPAEAIRLLTGDTPAAEKEEIKNRLASGELKVVIGTHALIEDPVNFNDLQLVVIDEQHRFGVDQRAVLRRKGTTPHLLVMTATPIPRSLALTLYGDLDLAVMDEMPAGRQPVSTFVLTPTETERAYQLIRGQIKAGRQAFVVYPLVEESEKLELKAAVSEQERLQKEIFPDLKVGLLHGRMRPDEKDRVMAEFRDGQYHILVSTTVIEVGVDVPNATVMLIEGANRFGLAQLHQLRGRVGRGGGESFCLLIPDKADNAENDRLKAMTETNDGFVLAERDLQQRGPGEFLGTRQSGYAATLKMASITDIKLIEKARTHAQKLFETDPTLSQPEHAQLAEAFNRFWGTGKGDVS
jgi:ATP-dependent DNA helicase RecG